MLQASQFTLYKLYDKAGTLLYVGKNANGNSNGRTNKHQNSWWGWRIDSEKTTLESFTSDAELTLAEVESIRAERPLYNIIHNGKVQEVTKEDVEPGDPFIKPKIPEGDWIDVGQSSNSRNRKGKGPKTDARWSRYADGSMRVYFGHPMPAFLQNVQYVGVEMDFKTMRMVMYEVPKHHPGAMLLRTENTGKAAQGRFQYRSIVWSPKQNPFHKENEMGFTNQREEPSFPRVLFVSLPEGFKPKDED